MRSPRSIMASYLPAALTGGVLLFAGCGGDQTDGEVVGPTEESKQSRAAIENQARQNPNMYAPPKGAMNRGSSQRDRRR